MTDDRVALLHELLVAPLRGDAGWLHDRIAFEVDRRGCTEEQGQVYGLGAWEGYKLALSVFEIWLGMTSIECKPQRFATHSNSSAGLPNGVMRVGEYRDDKSGLWYGEREDGGSCNG